MRGKQECGMIRSRGDGEKRGRYKQELRFEECRGERRISRGEKMLREMRGGREYLV